MQTVFVGLSGGVDSALSAALLKEEGYNVVGAFIKIWQPEFIECTWREDRLDAMRVCAALEIPYKEIDLSEEYKRDVVGRMIAEYARGITPNPDVLCNRAIKFGHFLEWALGSGADMIATGHYARIERRGNCYALLRGSDRQKDQSYFLYALSQESLARALFPVGRMEKQGVRAEAARRGIPVARKRDSQGLCFVGDVALPGFLSRYIALEDGDVVDGDGRVIGTHGGAALYTLGQRHGFRITAPHAAEMPHFVVRVDAASNTIVVSARREDAAVECASLSRMHWIREEGADGDAFMSTARYRQEAVETTFEMRSGRAFARFARPQIAAPGQSLVFYTGDECAGGGAVEAV